MCGNTFPCPNIASHNPIWKKSSAPIYGVVPGEAAVSLGTIELDVIFGSKGNFARKVLEFEVLD